MAKKTPDEEIRNPPKQKDADIGRYGNPLPGDTAVGGVVTPVDTAPAPGAGGTLPMPPSIGEQPHIYPAPGTGPTVPSGFRPNNTYVNYRPVGQGGTGINPSRAAVRQSDQPNSAMRGRGTPSGHGTPDAGAALPTFDPAALSQIADAIHSGIDQAGEVSEQPGFASGRGLGIHATGGLGGRRVSS